MNARDEFILNYRVRKLNPTVLKLAPTLLNTVFSVCSFAQLIVSVPVTADTQYWPRTLSGMNWEEKLCAIIISGLRAGSSVKETVKFHNFSGQRRYGLPAAQTAKPCTITFGAFARGCQQEPPQHCRLPEGEVHGRHGQPPEGHHGQGLQEVLPQD